MSLRALRPFILTLLVVPLMGAEPATQPADRKKKLDELTAADHVRVLLMPVEGSDAPSPTMLRLLTSLSISNPQAAAASDWAQRHRAAVMGVTLPDLPNTKSLDLLLTMRAGTDDRPTVLYLHSLSHHASGKLIAYGLSDENLKRAYWMGDPKKDLKVESTGRDLVIELTAKNGKPLDPVATVVALEFDGAPKPLSIAIQPEADGTVVLHSKQACVFGKNLRYEPEPHKNTLGYWSNPEDYCRWEFEVSEKTAYDVELLQGCGKGSGGSEVAIDIIDPNVKRKRKAVVDHFTMVVQDTGHFQNFVPRVVGRTTLEPGKYVIEVRPIDKKGVAVMDLRQVTLKPVKP